MTMIVYKPSNGTVNTNTTPLTQDTVDRLKRNWQVLSNKNKQDGIYYNQYRKEFALNVKRNWFVAFFRAIFVNPIRFTLRGFTSNNQRVFDGLIFLIKTLNQLKETLPPQEAKTLTDTVEKAIIAMRKMAESFQEKKRPIYVAALGLCCHNIDMVLNPTQQTTLRLPALQIQPYPLHPHDSNKATHGIASGGTGEINAENKDGNDQEVGLKPIALPSIEEYVLPEIKLKASPFVEFQQQERLARRNSSFEDLKKANQEYFEAIKELNILENSLKSIQSKNHNRFESIQQNQENNANGAPPPPPPLLLPPPPPPPPMLNNNSIVCKKISWRERENTRLAQADVKESEASQALENYFCSFDKMNTSFKTITSILFPHIENSSRIEISTDKLTDYVDKYLKIGNSEVQALEDQIQKDSESRKNKTESNKKRLSNRHLENNELDHLSPQAKKKIREFEVKKSNAMKAMTNLKTEESRKQDLENNLKVKIMNQNKSSEMILSNGMHISADQQKQFKESSLEINKAKEQLRECENRIATKKVAYEGSLKSLITALVLPEDTSLADAIEAVDKRIGRIKQESTPTQ